MPIIVKQFGGIIPRLNAELLPESGAQVAQNVALTSGKLVPLDLGAAATPPTGSVPEIVLYGPGQTQHSDGELLAGIPESEWRSIAKPSPPVLAGRSYPFDPERVRCRARVWVSWYDEEGDYHTETWGNQYMVLRGYKWTDVGLDMDFTTVTRPPQRFDRYVHYDVQGPRFEFLVPTGSRYVKLPDVVSPYDPLMPVGSVPIFDGQLQVGAFQVYDVQSKILDEDDMFVTEYEYLTKRLERIRAHVRVTLNWIPQINQRRYFYYVQSTTEGDENEYEGPPSEPSELIVLEPGQKLTLTVASPGKLYRAENTNDQFFLVDDLEAGTSYTDEKWSVQPEPLPPYGAYPDAGARAGSVVHPAHFALVFHGDHVYPSDYYRFWVYPEEWAIPFPSAVMALAISGGSVVVFTVADASEPGRVYLLHGGPDAMTKYELTDTSPMLNELSLCKVDGTVFYVSLDGLMAIDGGAPNLVTKEHFTRAEWLALDPATMVASVMDRSIFLENETVKLRFDLEEAGAAVSTYTATTGVALTWKSRKWRYDEPVQYAVARVIASAATTLTLWADGVQVYSASIADDEPVLLSLAAARAWEFQVESLGTVEEVALYEAVVRPVENGGVRLVNDGGVLSWKQQTIAFADEGSFAVARVQASAYPMTLKLFAAGALVHTATVSDNNDFKLPQTLASARLWHVEVTGAGRVDEVQLIGRRAQYVSAGLIRVNRGQEPWSWLGHRFMLSRAWAPKAARVHAEAYPVTLKLFAAGATTATHEVSVTSAAGFNLPILRREREWEVDVVAGAGVIVRDVTLGGSRGDLG